MSGMCGLALALLLALGLVPGGSAVSEGLGLGHGGRSLGAMSSSAARAQAAAGVAVFARSKESAAAYGREPPPAPPAKKPPQPGVPSQPLVPLEVKPAAGPVLVRAMDEANTDAEAFAAMFPAMNNSQALLKELDESAVRIKALRLKQAEKQNFLDELQVKESLLRADVKKDTVAILNLNAHVGGLHARLEKLKREQELAQLADKYNEINTQGQKLRSQVHEINSVKDALYNKMSDIHADIEALRARENRDLRLSINVDEVAADDRLALAGAAAVGAGGGGGGGDDGSGSGSGSGSSNDITRIVHAFGPLGSATVVSGTAGNPLVVQSSRGAVVAGHAGACVIDCVSVFPQSGARKAALL